MIMEGALHKSIAPLIVTLPLFIEHTTLSKSSRIHSELLLLYNYGHPRGNYQSLKLNGNILNTFECFGFPFPGSLVQEKFTKFKMK